MFGTLRALRRQIAAERDVPPYVVFSDAVLRAMARELPRTPAQLRAISGVGEKKLADFGTRFLAAIALEERIFNVKDVMYPAAGGDGEMTVTFTLLTYQYKG